MVLRSTAASRSRVAPVISSASAPVAPKLTTSSAISATSDRPRRKVRFSAARRTSIAWTALASRKATSAGDRSRLTRLTAARAAARRVPW